MTIVSPSSFTTAGAAKGAAVLAVSGGGETTAMPYAPEPCRNLISNPAATTTRLQPGVIGVASGQVGRQIGGVPPLDRWFE